MINKIFIIESLPIRDKHTGFKLYNETIIEKIATYKKEIEHHYISLETKDDFILYVQKINDSISANDELIIHIEAHGGREVLQFANFESIKWTELETLLIPLNTKCKNKLHLNLVTCFGMHSAEKINLTKTAPYKSYISALKKLFPEEIISDNSKLYDRIIETQNIFIGYIQFMQTNPETKLKIKDIETVLTLILDHQIDRFIGTAILKDFFDQYLNINIDNYVLANLASNEDKKEYILNLFLKRYLPDD